MNMLLIMTLFVMWFIAFCFIFIFDKNHEEKQTILLKHIDMNDYNHVYSSSKSIDYKYYNLQESYFFYIYLNEILLKKWINDKKNIENIMSNAYFYSQSKNEGLVYFEILLRYLKSILSSFTHDKNIKMKLDNIFSSNLSKIIYKDYSRLKDYLVVFNNLYNCNNWVPSDVDRSKNDVFFKVIPAVINYLVSTIQTEDGLIEHFLVRFEYFLFNIKKNKKIDMEKDMVFNFYNADANIYDIRLLTELIKDSFFNGKNKEHGSKCFEIVALYDLTFLIYRVPTLKNLDEIKKEMTSKVFHKSNQMFEKNKYIVEKKSVNKNYPKIKLKIAYFYTEKHIEDILTAISKLNQSKLNEKETIKQLYKFLKKKIEHWKNKVNFILIYINNKILKIELEFIKFEDFLSLNESHKISCNSDIDNKDGEKDEKECSDSIKNINFKKNKDYDTEKKDIIKSNLQKKSKNKFNSRIKRIRTNLFFVIMIFYKKFSVLRFSNIINFNFLPLSILNQIIDPQKKKDCKSLVIKGDENDDRLPQEKNEIRKLKPKYSNEEIEKLGKTSFCENRYDNAIKNTTDSSQYNKNLQLVNHKLQTLESDGDRPCLKQSNISQAIKKKSNKQKMKGKKNTIKKKIVEPEVNNLKNIFNNTREQESTKTKNTSNINTEKNAVNTSQDMENNTREKESKETRNISNEYILEPIFNNDQNTLNFVKEKLAKIKYTNDEVTSSEKKVKPQEIALSTQSITNKNNLKEKKDFLDHYTNEQNTSNDHYFELDNNKLLGNRNLIISSQINKFNCNNILKKNSENLMLSQETSSKNLSLEKNSSKSHKEIPNKNFTSITTEFKGILGNTISMKNLLFFQKITPKSQKCDISKTFLHGNVLPDKNKTVSKLCFSDNLVPSQKSSSIKKSKNSSTQTTPAYYKIRRLHPFVKKDRLTIQLEPLKQNQICLHTVISERSLVTLTRQSSEIKKSKSLEIDNNKLSTNNQADMEIISDNRSYKQAESMDKNKTNDNFLYAPHITSSNQQNEFKHQQGSVFKQNNESIKIKKENNELSACKDDNKDNEIYKNLSGTEITIYRFPNINLKDNLKNIYFKICEIIDEKDKHLDEKIFTLGNFLEKLNEMYQEEYIHRLFDKF